MGKKLLFFVFLLVSALIMRNLIISSWSLWHKGDLLIHAQKALDQEKAANQKLQANLGYVKTQGFVEEEARNKLFMAKPNEQEVLIDQRLLEKQETQKKNTSQTPTWQKWVALFVY